MSMPSPVDLLTLLAHARDENREAHLDDILSQLQDDAVPRQSKQAAAHLEAVLKRMSECDRIVGRTRSLLMLQQMRTDES